MAEEELQPEGDGYTLARKQPPQGNGFTYTSQSGQAGELPLEGDDGFVTAPQPNGGAPVTLDEARQAGDFFLGDVFWDDDHKAVFGRRPGELDRSFGQVYFDTGAGVFAIESTKSGSGAAGDIVFRTGDPLAEALRITAAGRARGNVFTVAAQSSHPSAELGAGQVYSMDVAGTVQLFYRASDGTMSQLTPAGASTGWQQGGNSFGAVGILGTNDAFDLSIRAGGVEAIRVDDATQRVGVGGSPGAFRLDIFGDARVQGKLTVAGAIDPTSVLLSGGTALFYESNDGSTAPVSGAATGRIRYNNGTGTWQASVQGGAYADIGGGGVSGSGAAGQVTYFTAAAVVAGDAGLTYDAANNALTVGVARVHSTGTSNTFAGQVSGNFTLTGTLNSAFGRQTLGSLTTGGGNSAFGANALFFTTSGASNCAFGLNALAVNTTASGNNAFGSLTLRTNTTGANNNAFGLQALELSTTASGNNAFGAVSLRNNTTGANNNAFGLTALELNLTGMRNSAFGDASLRVSMGDDNSAFGRAAGLSLTTGGACTFLGATADTTLATAANSTAVGFGASVDASNTMVFGNASLVLVRPGSNGGCDLGSAAFRWADGWFSGDVAVGGKLTVTGAIDPTSVLLSGGTALFIESNDGSTAPVSGAATGRLRYNNGTGTWQASVQGGAYADIGGGGGGVSGSGTAGRMAKWTGATAVGDGPLDSNVGNTVVNPTGDNAVTMGSSALRFVSVSSIFFDVFNAASDSNPSTSLRSGQLFLGPGGGSLLDTRIARTGSSQFTVTNAAGSATGTFAPNADNEGDVGTPALRWGEMSAVFYNVFNAASDANPSTSLRSGQLFLGPGGGSLLDTRIARTGSSRFTVTNAAGSATGTFAPNADSEGAVGTSALRWAAMSSIRFDVYAAASDTNPSSSLLSGALYLGTGGASLVVKVVGTQGAAVADAAGGATVDAEARTAINTLLARVRASTGHGLIAG
jgi:hypothetical protein